MKTPKPFHDKTLTDKQWFWFLAMMGLLTRLSLLNFFKAETTDGILSLTYFSPQFVDTPRFVILPGYPLLLWMTGDHAFVGRLLASLAGLLFLIPLWKFAKRWMSSEMTGMVCLMALFSPLLWQWSLKVMGDTFFLLLFWWGLERLTTAFVEKRESPWWQANLLGALAALTRPEGFLLFPWVAALTIRISTGRRWVHWLSVLLFWAAPFFFLTPIFSTLQGAFLEGLGLTNGAAHVDFPLINFVDHLHAYLMQPIFVFTPLIFLFAVLGLGKMVRRQDVEGEAFKKITLQVYILLFLTRLVPVSYQDRHLLPFLPILLVAAGYHLETFFKWWGEGRTLLATVFFKNSLLFFCLIWLALLSSAVLIAQNDSFGDIKRSGQFLKTLPSSAVIYSDEVPKTRYWSGREIKLIVLPFKPKNGDYVIRHSFYTPRLNYMDQEMSERRAVVRIFESHSMVVPILTDIMMNPALQNRVKAAAFRFEPQFFTSRVYRIQKNVKPDEVL
jgi:hypothetical protein